MVRSFLSGILHWFATAPIEDNKDWRGEYVEPKNEPMDESFRVPYNVDGTDWNETKPLEFPIDATHRDTLGFAVKATNQKQADVIIEALIVFGAKHGLDRQAALERNANNLSYFVGYYDRSVQQRVSRLYAELLKYKTD